jgi:hypothetical protein
MPAIAATVKACRSRGSGAATRRDDAAKAAIPTFCVRATAAGALQGRRR